MAGGRAWTREEDAALLATRLTPHTERFTGRSALREVARNLGRSRVACVSRYYKLRRERGHIPGRQWTREGLWSPAEDDMIRRQLGEGRAPDGTWEIVSGRIGRTRKAVTTRACRLRKLAKGRE